MNYYIWTIGCQMNRAESERLAAGFEHLGYQAVSTAEQADLILLNSCVVRQSAERRVVNKLAALRTLKKRRPGLMLAVTGCLVNADTASLEKRFPHVDSFFGPGGNPPWLDTSIGFVLALPRQSAVSAFVPIIQGCNNFCAYCIVPYRRGRERSRPLAEIVGEVEELVCRGTQEVTLLGQNVDSYGQDLPARPGLADLLDELDGVDGLIRIRFLTSHPKDMSRRLIAAVARGDKVCEQISLPVQAGSDDILEAMRRGYTVAHYWELVREIRRQVPEVSLSTDVIVGFPSETEAQFEQTYALLSELRFDTVHIAAYSPRPGTLAARELADDVPPAEKQRRFERLERLQETVSTELNAILQGRTLEVLVEGRKGGRWWGRTRGGKLVFFPEKGDCLGRLVQVNIEKTSPWSLQGRAVTNDSQH